MINILLERSRVDTGTRMEAGIAANTYGASPPGRNTGHTVADTTDYSAGHTVADTTDYNASIPTRCMDRTVPQFHPKTGRNSRGHIPVPVHHGRLEQTNIKA